MKKIILLIFIFLFVSCSMFFRKNGVIITNKNVKIEFKKAIITIDENYVYVAEGELGYIIPREDIKSFYFESVK